jgi:apolipoprotein N-acyltransferase
VGGAACVLGFAPFYFWPAPVLGLAVLFRAWQASGSPRQAALAGLAFGLGLFLAGVSWVYVSMHVHGAMPAVLAALATLLFCSYLAAFPAMAGWLVVRLAPAPGIARLAAMAAGFVLLEWLRGVLFTGFPWLVLGTSQAPGSPLAGYAPVLGGYGVSLAMAASSALLVALLLPAAGARPRAIAAGGLVAVFAVGAALRLVAWSTPEGSAISTALIQGNVPQELKWREEVRARTFADYRQRVLDAPAGLVVLPETALPAFFDRLPPGYVDALRGHAREAGKHILLGSVERRFEAGRFDYYNSVVVVDEGPARSYRKRHLVPFGEFIPRGFGWVLHVLKIPLTDFARGEAAQPPLAVAGTAIGVAICYEDIFGEEVIDQLPAAKILLNVSNDAWFGKSLAADQHLQSSQMRAIETGRWVVRATNTGVTAAIDETGRVSGQLAQFTAGTLVSRVQPRAGTTPYVRWGNLPALALMLVTLAMVWRRRY